jgi:hypothetical protein
MQCETNFAKIFTGTVFCLSLLQHISAQQTIVDNDFLHNLLTDIAVDQEDQDLDQLLELLEDIIENPVFINHASREDLSRIVWLTEFQIHSLLEHVRRNGAIVSYYEIATIVGFTPELAQTLIPFISLEQKPETNRIQANRAFRYGKNRLMFTASQTLNEQEGYIRPDSVLARYLGNPLKANVRYSFNYANRLYFGFTGSKNAGEPFFRENNQYGFDFYSTHFQLNTDGLIKTLTIGDFRADFGQGLTLWSGFGFGKSAMILNAMKYNAGLRRYTSLDKNRFMRGSGITLRFKPLDLSIFYSRKPIDATITERNQSDKAIIASSFPTDGYHRTPNEMSRKDAATEQITGANVTVRRTNWQIGATAVYYDFDVTLIPNSYIYNHFEFAGKSNSNYSFDFRFRLGNAILYGEQAISQNGGTAILYGTQMLVGEQLVINMLYRRYDKKYHARHGRAHGEYSRNNNEEGFFASWNLNAGGRWRFSSFYDIFRSPWLRYRADAPTFGQEAMLRIDYTPRSNAQIYLQLRHKNREENANDHIIRAVTDTKTNSAKISLTYRIQDGYGTNSHIEIKRYEKQSQQSGGYFIAQDIYGTFNTFNRYPIKITVRYAFFDTDDYNSRIYSYENDLLYAFSIPAFHYQGTRFYVLGRYSLNKLDFRIKYSVTRYTNRNEIGSGLNRIRENKIADLRGQVIYKF